MRGAWLRWGLLAVWVGVVLALGSTTTFPENGQVPRFLVRTGAHLGLYSVLGLLGYAALAPRGARPGAGRLLGALALTVAIAAAGEWRQAFVPGRSARLCDVGLDAVGGTVGLVAALALLRGQVLHSHIGR